MRLQQQTQHQEQQRLNHQHTQVRQQEPMSHQLPTAHFASASLQPLSSHATGMVTTASSHMPHAAVLTCHTTGSTSTQQPLTNTPSSYHQQYHHPQSTVNENVQVAIPAMGHMSSPVPGGNLMPLHTSSSVLPNLTVACPTVMSVTNGCMNATTSPSSTSSSSSSSSSSDHNTNKSSTNGPGEGLRLKPINTKEFEDVVGSSPFDDALLRSIDDRQELNSVFANVLHHPAPQPPPPHPNNHFNGPHHSPYNTFNPR